MRTLLLATAAIALVGGIATPAHAVVCTGTTQSVASGGTATAEFLLTPGNCVASGDKIFGEFAASGAITGNGAASFQFFQNPGSVTLGFLGTVGPSSVGGITYSVQVDPVLSQGFLIDGLEKDLTFNASGAGLATASLSGGVTAPFAVAFDCSRTLNPTGGTCPESHLFAPVDQITVDETFTTSSTATITGLTDTIIQTAPVSEPGSLALLGTGLLGLIAGHRWMRRRKDDNTGCHATG